MKILNLYAGIGGNRKFWGNTHDITAVELNPEIAKIYQDFFPNDKMIITDAHEYLLEHFKEYDFIWSSPPCPTHSRIKKTQCNTISKKTGKYLSDIKYPDMKLYQEIILLQEWFNGLYCVENVIGYYEPLIQPQKMGRHYYWANFFISFINIETGNIQKGKRDEWKIKTGFDLSKYKINHRKDTLYRNIMNPKLGLHILNCAMGTYDCRKNQEQLSLL